MITTELVIPRRTGHPSYYRPMTTATAEIFLRNRSHQADQWTFEPVASCPCCGEPAWENGRCTKHQHRNPCAIEGCKRVHGLPQSGALSSEEWICGDHWKRLVPPRSLTRRAYNRHLARAKRYGWDAARADAFRRFWSSLVAQARRRADGGMLDQKAIERMFGWDQ